MKTIFFGILLVFSFQSWACPTSPEKALKSDVVLLSSCNETQKSYLIEKIKNLLVLTEVSLEESRRSIESIEREIQSLRHRHEWLRNTSLNYTLADAHQYEWSMIRYDQTKISLKLNLEKTNNKSVQLNRVLDIFEALAL